MLSNWIPFKMVRGLYFTRPLLSCKGEGRARLTKWILQQKSMAWIVITQQKQLSCFQSLQRLPTYLTIKNKSSIKSQPEISTTLLTTMPQPWSSIWKNGSLSSFCKMMLAKWESYFSHGMALRANVTVTSWCCATSKNQVPCSYNYHASKELTICIL